MDSKVAVNLPADLIEDINANLAARGAGTPGLKADPDGLVAHVVRQWLDAAERPAQPEPVHEEAEGPGPNRYGKIHVEVADPDKPTFTVNDIRAKAESIYAEDPFVQIFVDHAGLVDPEGRYTSTTDKLNEVFKDLKKLARGFRSGAGTAVCALHQINRAGLASALKKKEAGRLPRYDLTNLSYANEAERSSDVITTSWVDDDLRRDDLVLIDCLKAREQAPFDPFYANVRFGYRRMLTCNTKVPQNAVVTKAPEGSTAAARGTRSQTSVLDTAAMLAAIGR